MREAVVEKIVQVSVSPKFTAILDAMLDIEPRRTEPAFYSLIACPPGFLGMQYGDIGYNDFLGALSDLERNCHGVAEAAELTEGELEWFLAQMPGR